MVSLIYVVAGRASLDGLASTCTDAISVTASDVNDKNEVSCDTNKSVICFIILRSSSVKLIIMDSLLMPGFEPNVRV